MYIREKYIHSRRGRVDIGPDEYIGGKELIAAAALQYLFPAICSTPVQRR